MISSSRELGCEAASILRNVTCPRTVLSCCTSYTDAWTGVSRVPWLTALALWPWGTTYGGGGRFLGPHHVRLRAGCDGEPHPDHPGYGLTVESGRCALHQSTDEVDGADWTGRARSGELIYARGSKSYRRSTKGMRDRVVADLNGLKPDPQPAPASATRPLSSQRREDDI